MRSALKVALAALSPLAAAAFLALFVVRPLEGRIRIDRVEWFVLLGVLSYGGLSVLGAASGAVRLALGALVPSLRLQRRGRAAALALTAVGLGIALAFAYARFVEPHWLRVRVEQVQSPKVRLPVRLVVVSDLHSDARFDLDGRVAAEVNRLEPDVVLFLGDSVNHPDRLDAFRAGLSAMRARSAKLAVRGNWDVWYWDDLPVFEGTGFVELSAGWKVVETRLTRLAFRGLPWAAWHADVLSGDAPPEGAFSVLLYHSHDLLEAAAAAGFDLAVNGDTHGGQVALPVWGPLVTVGQFGRRYARGRFQLGATTAYVTPGVGVEESLPLRFGVRPELTVIDLAPAD